MFEIIIIILTFALHCAIGQHIVQKAVERFKETKPGESVPVLGVILLFIIWPFLFIASVMTAIFIVMTRR